MLRKIVVLALGIVLGSDGAQAASAIPVLPGAPVISAQPIAVGHRHARGHDRRGYDRRYHPARPRYRDRGHYRPRHGYHRGYRGRYPVHGQGNAYPRGHRHGAWQDYLRDRYGK